MKYSEWQEAKEILDCIEEARKLGGIGIPSDKLLKALLLLLKDYIERGILNGRDI